MNVPDNTPPSTNDLISLVEKKLVFFEDVMQSTTVHVKNMKLIDVFNASDVNGCMTSLSELSKKIKQTRTVLTTANNEHLINELQAINNELSGLFKCFGTNSLDDMLWVCFGNNYSTSFLSKMNEMEQAKFALLKKYVHPIGYKVVNHTPHKPSKDDKKKSKSVATGLNVKEETSFVDLSNNLDCSEITTGEEKFHMRVKGIKAIIKHSSQNKTLVVSGIVDDVNVDFLNNAYINNVINSVKAPTQFEDNNFARYVNSLTLKELLLCSGQDIISKYAGIQNRLQGVKKQPISATVKDFISNDLYYKREMIAHLLVNNADDELQYIAYLLYDLLSNDANGAVDTQEQTELFDSLSWNTKTHFKDAMKLTVKYTTNLSNFDFNKVPLEQQICLLKASDSVKEKAMQKLKEMKSKSDDSGSKARQYLEALLKIPFKIYRKEPILHFSKKLKVLFEEALLLSRPHTTSTFGLKRDYTTAEIYNQVNALKQAQLVNVYSLDKMKPILSKCRKHVLQTMIDEINKYIIVKKIAHGTLPDVKKNKQESVENICLFLNEVPAKHKYDARFRVLEDVLNADSNNPSRRLYEVITEMDNQFNTVNTYFSNVKKVMDDAIYGHDKAKMQLERIICQWINGEQDGHCFGFEGPPGVGKTSLAKYGLSMCLTDENGVGRPFSMIQIGGDSNGSSLHGHNYTYVGSNWGSIVQILIDKKCMNPIIFIDEVDKISKTEQGREIVGILTHLLDSTQNDCFQDKYFSGIEIDMSKALFILSYNDPESIDKILLDRIHRIKFSNLSVDEKVVICKKHVLPEICKKMGLTDAIEVTDDIIKFVIEEYTCEPGVRKLKELWFEIIGEINKTALNKMSNNVEDVEIPSVVKITKEMISTECLKERKMIKRKKIHQASVAGIINGLWANAMGQGGVIQIQTHFSPSSKFLDLNLTGLQGDVMKESMSVALTLAWSLTPTSVQNELKARQDSKTPDGIHIHCPEGATPKDGPSAGTAITCAIYSLLNNKKIKHHFAITGEISLDGRVTEIGGLDLKILGGIKAGVTDFIYPEENQADFEKLFAKYGGTELFANIHFYKAHHIDEVFQLIFE